MRNFDYRGLDAALLSTLIAVVEENSVTNAADRLHISQSTLSHRLDKLRTIFDDQLFVRRGRGIEPTAFLKSTMPRVHEAETAIRGLFEQPFFSPAEMTGDFVIAGTDYERAVILYGVGKDILEQAPDVSLNFVWERYDNDKPLVSNEFDLAVCPYIEKVQHAEIHEELLFDDYGVCFFDPEHADPIRDLDDYLSRKHISIIFSTDDTSFVDAALHRIGKKRDISIRMPSVSELLLMMKGTDLIVTMPFRFSETTMSEFGYCELPFHMPRINYGMFWHSRHDNSSKHIWFRDLIRKAAKRL